VTDIQIKYIVCVLLLLSLQACSSTPTVVPGGEETDVAVLYQRGMELAQVDGNGEAVDSEAGRRLLVEAASQDYMPAIHALGWMELRGIGVEQDRARAFQNFLRAARAGYAESQYMLGVLYAQGWGVAKSSTDSLYWIKKAADQGHVQASNMLRNLFASPAGHSATDLGLHPN